MLNVDIEELEKIFSKILHHYKEQQITILQVDKDYYWHIPKERKYAVYEKPDDLTIGQLSDDWKELRRLLNNDNSAISYNFVWLANILRVIGEDEH